jgi:hypothetical protein
MKKHGAPGQGMTEFALILALVVVAAVLVLSVMGPVIGKTFHNAADNAVNADVSKLGYRLTQTYVATVNFTPVPTVITCYTLTLSHSGSGSIPISVPTNSTGCPAGKFVFNESIQLSGAVPALGWQIVSWSGTANNSSTSSTNSLTMPAASTSASVNYAQSCFTLTLTHSGAGSDPVANPTNSSGCTSGHFVYGEAITLTAVPGTGQAVSSWNGTSNDSSTSTTNTLSMPASGATVNANYVAVCYTLTLSHTGTGNNPTASPANSSGCSSGQYVYNATINLTAAPGAGWQVGSWTGATGGGGNNASLSMPANAATASVTYTSSCNSLTLSHSGTGSDPTANPLNSSGCPSGQYTYNQSITLTALPGTGWQVGSWTGATAGGGNTATLSMPANATTASVTYSLACYTLTLTYSGTGNNPTASPTNSTGCTSGNFHYNEIINLTAAPAIGWELSSWSGTDDDTSTASTNTLTMPNMAATVSATYIHSCFHLDLFHTGTGGNPTAVPANSTGCPSGGNYYYGTSINLTATPGSGQQIGSWTGATQGAGNSASLSMPASDSAATVNYTPICYALALSHTGSGAGSNPTASPSSKGCSSGNYAPGESITLTAHPNANNYVTGWTGTTANGSIANTNTKVMSNGPDSASVGYITLPRGCPVNVPAINTSSKGYYFVLTTNYTGTITATWTPASGSSRVYIYDNSAGNPFTGNPPYSRPGSPNPIAQSTGGTGSQTATVTNKPAGTYYIFFYARSGYTTPATTGTITSMSLTCP